MNSTEMWRPIVTMVAVDFALAVVNLLLKKALTGGLNYLVCITYRQVISAVFLAPLAYCIERKSWAKLTCRIIWCLFIISALLGATLTSYFFLIGLKFTSATYSTAFLNIVPVTTFVMAVCFRLEKVNMECRSGRAKVIGTLICVGGAIILTVYKGMPIINPNNASSENVEVFHSAKRWAIGSVFLALSILTWSSWFVVQATIGKSYPFPYSSTAITSFFCAIQSAVLSLFIDRNISVWILKGPIEITTVLYAGIVGSGICYVVMCWCIKVRGPVFTSAFSPMMQMFVAIFDVSILHEQIYLGSILGSLAVIVGLYILLWGKSYEGETCKLQEEERHHDGDCDRQVTTPDTDCPTHA